MTTFFNPKQHKELTAACCLCSLIITGIIFDTCHIVIIHVVNLGDIVLTVLQMQGTLATLTIALIAMISGFINETHYGISVSDFYLNIRPQVFTHKRTIVAAFILMITGVFCFLFGWYNSIFCCFLVTCALIVISLIELYSIFDGKESNSHLIEKYVIESIQTSTVLFSKKETLFRGFVHQWSESNQANSDFERDKKTYLKFIETLFSENAANALPIISSAASEYVKRTISSSNTSGRYRAFEVFGDTYRVVEKNVRLNKKSRVSAEFNLGLDCLDDIIAYKKNISNETYISYIRSQLHLTILDVTIYCHPESISDTEAINKVAPILNHFLFNFGTIPSNSQLNGMDYNLQQVFFSPTFLGFCDNSLPPSLMGEYSLTICKLEFSLFLGLLKGHNKEIIASLFKNRYFENCTTEEFLFMLVCICYLLYIAYYESTNYITDDEREVCTFLLNTCKTEGTMDLLTGALAYPTHSVDYKAICIQLHSIIDSSEKMPQDGSMKFSVVPSVINDFLLYVAVQIAFLGNQRFTEIMTAYPSPDDWYGAYCGVRLQHTQKQIFQISELLSSSTALDENIDEELERFQSVVTENCSRHALISAHNHYQTFIENRPKDELIKELNNSIENHIKEVTGAWCEPAQAGSHITVNQEYRVPVTTIHAKGIENLLPYIDQEILNQIEKTLWDNNSLIEIRRCSTNTDDKFFEVLEEGQIKFIVGSRYAMAPAPNTNHKKLRQLTQKMSISIIGREATSLLLSEKIHLSLHSCNIGLRPPKADEAVAVQTQDGKKFQVLGTMIPLQYTKEELVDYISHEKQVVSVSVDLIIQLPETKIGYFLIREKK